LSLAAAVALLAGCGGGSGDEPTRATGPVAVLYVTDHLGAEPRPGHLAPYAKAFRRVRAGCRIGPDALANRVIQVTEQASTGSGTALTNLDTLRALARHVGTTPKDCTDTFALVEARLEGGALD
jgi:hypothetical protein